MLRIAIQAKGRLNEQSTQMLSEAGICVEGNDRRFLTKAENFPVEVLYLRDDDIPQAVALGAADAGIVGLNEVAEKGFDLEIEQKLGFGGCRLSLAVPKAADYSSIEWFNGKKVATSYPKILSSYFKDKGIEAEIHTISGSVEIAPAVGLGDAIFDIVSSGGTLVRNGLKEIETVLSSEAVLIAGKNIEEEKKAVLEQIKFRFGAVIDSRDKKYLLMNIPNERLEEAVRILPSMRSPTILPLAQDGWSSLHSVVEKHLLWEKIEKLKAIGAEGILVLSVEKLVL